MDTRLKEVIQRHLKDKGEQQEVLKALEEKVKQQEQVIKKGVDKIEEQKAKIADLQELCNEPIPKNIRELHKRTIKEWTEDDHMFLETRASKDADKKIESVNHLVVTGSSGNGKSFTVRHIALQLHKYQGYDVIPFLPNGPSDILLYRVLGRKQVFVIDDICGKATLNVKLIDDWSAHLEHIESMVSVDNSTNIDRQTEKKTGSSEERVQGEKTSNPDDKNPMQPLSIIDAQDYNSSRPRKAMGDMKILMTCRLHIFSDPRFVQSLSFLTTSHCNLLSDNLRLTSDEKLQLLAKYVNEKNIPYISQLLDQDFDFFPLLCKLGANKALPQLETLFSNPTESIKRDFKELKLKDKTHYCVILCVLLNTVFNEEWLVLQNAPSGIKEAMRSTFHECGLDLDQEASRQLVKEHLGVLNNTYLKRSGNQYRIIHDKIFDILAVICIEHLPELFLQHASSSFIGDRYIFASVDTTYDDNLSILPRQKENDYFCRLVRDLEKGEMYSTLQNKQLSHSSYRERFIRFCNLKRSTIELHFKNLRNNKTQSQTTPLCQAVLTGYCDIVEMLLDMNIDINETDVLGQTAFFLACSSNKVDILKLLKDKNADVSICDINGRTPLNISCRNGHVAVVETLLGLSIDVSQCDKAGKSPLFTACSNGHAEILQLLLANNPDISICYRNGETLLYVAVLTGHSEVVELLLNKGLDVNQCTSNGSSPLHAASFIGHANVAKILLKRNADVRLCDKDKLSALHTASSAGHLDIVNLLISSNADVNCADRHGRSPLQAAATCGHTDIVELLLDNNAEVDKFDRDGMSALHVASQYGYESIVWLLHKEKADINQLNKRGMSSIYLASSNGHQDLVQLLLDL